MVMIHTHAKGQGQRLLGSKVRVETDGWRTDRSDCITSHANVVNKQFLYLFCKLGLLRWVPSVLWHCWFGVRKGIWPVKNWVVGCWQGYLSGARRCRFAYGPAHATATHCLLIQ